MKTLVTVEGQTLRWYGKIPEIADNSVQFVQLEFSLPEDWAGLVVVAQFSQTKTYNRLLENGCCYLPAELVAGPCEVSLFGQRAGETVRATSVPLRFKISRSGFTSTAETPIPPTPDLYAQLLEKLGHQGPSESVSVEDDGEGNVSFVPGFEGDGEDHELNSLNTGKTVYTSFPDKVAREGLKGKLANPGGLTPGKLLRVKSVDQDSNILLEGVDMPEGSSVTIDTTLTQPGQAADAKATGDAISKLSQQNAYVLPVGGEELGGVKNGGNVVINADGTMTAPEDGTDVSGLSMEFEGTTLTLKIGGETLDTVGLPTVPAPVSNPRTDCVLTVAGSGALSAGVILRNPNRLTALDVDINFEVTSGTLNKIEPWIYPDPQNDSFSGNSIPHVAAMQIKVGTKVYTEGNINYTFSAADDRIGVEYVGLVFNVPDTVNEYRIEFNSLGGFEVVRTVRFSVLCGPLDTLRLGYSQEYSSVRLLSRWAGKRYLALGDSLTDIRVNTPDYPGLLKDILGLAIADNLGVSGAKIVGGFVDRKKRLSFDYDLITIMMGVNDHMFASGDIGDVASSEYDTATFAGAYRDLLDYIIENNPKAMIVLIQPIWYAGQNKENSQGKTLEDYREAVRQIADIYNLPTLNLRTGFNSKNASTFYRGDNLHLLPEGQKRMADILGQFLCTV